MSKYEQYDNQAAKFQSPPMKRGGHENDFGSPSRKVQLQNSPSPLKRADKQLGAPVEIVPNKLYFLSDQRPPTNIENAFFFNIDKDLTYMPFNKDFGPLNIAMVHRYCRELNKLLQQKDYQGNVRIYHYTQATNDRVRLTNSAFLIGAFMIISLNYTAAQAYSRLAPYHGLFRCYRDASKGDCNYDCTVEHCLEGLEFGVKRGWYSYENFNVREYEHYEKVENGDLNWIIPGKFMAFMGPVDRTEGERAYGHSGSSYVNIFKHLKVSKVVRLNDPKYDKNAFSRHGIEHEDLIFMDGSVPPESIVDRFVQGCEQHFAKPNSGAVAVHCKAGLGRTGTLIGIYCMKHY